MLRAEGPLDSAVTAANSQPASAASAQSMRDQRGLHTSLAELGDRCRAAEPCNAVDDLHRSAADGSVVEEGEEGVRVRGDGPGPADLVVGDQRARRDRPRTLVEHVEPLLACRPLRHARSEALRSSAARSRLGREREHRPEPRRDVAALRQFRRASASAPTTTARSSAEGSVSTKNCSIASTSAGESSSRVTPIARFT